MKIKNLNRQEYISSTSNICHKSSKEFAKQALEYWDDYYSWADNPCLCLEKNGEDVCYLFYHLSQDKRYLIINNILTPNKHRYCGHAKFMLKTIFEKYSIGSVTQRVKMFCVSSSLKFYMKLGIDFWGVNKLGQYYTEFALPKNGIDGIYASMEKETLSTLYNREIKVIYEKLKLNGSEFNKKENEIFQKALLLMGKRYRFNELYNLIKS